MNVNDPHEIETQIQRLEAEEREGVRALESVRSDSHAAQALTRELARDRAQLEQLRRQKRAIELPAQQRAAAEKQRAERQARAAAQQADRETKQANREAQRMVQLGEGAVCGDGTLVGQPGRGRD